MNRKIHPPSRPAALLIAAVLLLACAVQHAQAHRLNIFASATTDHTIEGKVYFSGGRPAVNTDVSIQNQNGDKINLVQTDSHGRFKCRHDLTGEITLIATTGDGHQATFTINTPHSTETQTATSAPSTDTEIHTTNHADRALVQQIHELRYEIQQLTLRITVRDIIGAIGYIFGITGLAFYLMTRNRLKNNSHSEP